MKIIYIAAQRKTFWDSPDVAFSTTKRGALRRLRMRLAHMMDEFELEKLTGIKADSLNQVQTRRLRIG